MFSYVMTQDQRPYFPGEESNDFSVNISFSGFSEILLLSLNSVYVYYWYCQLSI